MDLLVANGGTAILAETPEIYGAENLLLERAVSPEVGQRLIGLLDDVETAQGGEAELQRLGTEIVMARYAILRDQADALKAGEIAVGLAGGHAGGLRERGEGHRAAGLAQHVEQGGADLDRLDAALAPGAVRLVTAAARAGKRMWHGAIIHAAPKKNAPEGASLRKRPEPAGSLARHHPHHLQALVGVAPFVVIPGDNLYKRPANDHVRLQVHDR